MRCSSPSIPITVRPITGTVLAAWIALAENSSSSRKAAATSACRVRSQAGPAMKADWGYRPLSAQLGEHAVEIRQTAPCPGRTAKSVSGKHKSSGDGMGMVTSTDDSDARGDSQSG